MRKNRLVTDLHYDFNLYGLIAPVKDHKLAWNLNQIEFFHFIRGDDIQLEFSDNSKISISNFKDESDQHNYLLIRNKLQSSNSSRNQFVLSELREFDFFLKLETSVDEFDFDPLISSIKNSPTINYLVKLDIEKIKQKENLLF